LTRVQTIGYNALQIKRQGIVT